MKTEDFRKKLTSSQILENMNKMFGMTVNLNKYSREQLEDMRNKLRTRMFQLEGQAGVNDLLTNETYQKDKAMLDLLNTRIKEMLGEDIKKLKDKLQQLDEAKKGVRAPKYMKKAKGSKGVDQTGDGKKDFDDVQVARMVAGGVPKKTAIAKATSDKFEEDATKGKWPGTPGGHQPGKEEEPKTGSTRKTATGHTEKNVAPGVKRYTKDAPTNEAAKSCNHTAEGKMCEVHGKKACPKMESVVAEKAVSRAQQQAAGIALAAQRSGKAPKKGTASAEMSKMPKKELEKFAKTTHKGLPKKKADESVQTYRKHVQIVNESLGYLLAEDEEEKAHAITAAGDMANDFTSWMQRVGQYQTKVMIELSDEIRHNFGAAQAEAFKQAVSPALAATLETLTTQREAISGAIAALAGEQMPTEPMGVEPMEPAAEMPPEEPIEPAAPDEMNMPGDEFAASDAGAAGREMRESRFSRKLAESHLIIATLAK